MKKRKIIGAAAILGTSALLGGCFPQPSYNVYGPPPASSGTNNANEAGQTQTVSEQLPDSSEGEDISVNDDNTQYDESLNIAEDVYGPPEWFD